MPKKRSGKQVQRQRQYQALVEIGQRALEWLSEWNPTAQAEWDQMAARGDVDGLIMAIEEELPPRSNYRDTTTAAGWEIVDAFNSWHAEHTGWIR
jgi:hypothetical protein